MTALDEQKARAHQLDEQDPVKKFRDRFFIPKKNGKEVLYLCGNSLGLQPKSVPSYLEAECKHWESEAVEGHFTGERPWMPYHRNFRRALGKLVGAEEHEVVAMNSVTANLHLMMVSFYRPDDKRFKIICEEGAFPSDQYALETQVKYHGYDPDEAIIEIHSPNNDHYIPNDHIQDVIRATGDELALVMIGGLQYYTGQFFDLKAITETAHEVGAIAGFDLAHAIGNVPLNLHNWDVDFAVWCSYKYVNSGPGAVGGTYVHQKHHKSDLPQFAGWWGHDEKERFLMKKGFKPAASVDRWQLSNAPVFNMVPHLASLEIFEEVGLPALRDKSKKLTTFLESLIKEHCGDRVEILTPSSSEERGCQLSLSIKGGGRPLFDKLVARGVISDWREPNVIRVAPVPLYNTFTEVFNFVSILREELLNE